MYVTSDKGNSSMFDGEARRKSRRSFINRSRDPESDAATPDDDIVEVLKNRKETEKMDEWKKSYIVNLRKEQTDWKNMFSATTFKYKGCKSEIQKTRRLFNESLLSEEEREFLNGTGIYKQVADNLKTLHDAATLNHKLKVTELERKNRLAHFLSNELVIISELLYRSIIDSNIDENTIYDSSF